VIVLTARRVLGHKLVVLAVALAACRAREGGDCDDTPASCVDRASRLICVDKRYVLEKCSGQRGCNDDGKTVLCDDTKAGVGDGCAQDGARACSSDGTQELRCREHKFAVEWTCRGGCTLDANGNPKCTPVGEVGDQCRPDSIVCNRAQTSQLACSDGKLALRRTCHGAMGCQTAPGGAVRCDRTVAFEEEPCTEEGAGACDTSRKNVLVCSGGRFKTEQRCLGELGCELPGNYSVRCDKSIVMASEPCDEEGAVTCTTEGKQVKCAGGQWVRDKTWKPKKGETCNNRFRKSRDTEKFDAR
jgi:hypothetical protein